MLLAFALLLQDKWLFEDPLAGKLGKGWSWTRESAGGWAFEKTALKLKPLPGSLAEKANDAKNLLVRALPPLEADALPLGVEVEIADAPGADGEQAGLLLYQDDDTWVSLARANVKGALHVVFSRELKGFHTPLATRPETGASHRLRLRWEDRRILAELLPAGSSKWLVGGYCESPFLKREAVKAALYASGGPAEGTRLSSFRNFKLGHPAPVD